MKFRNFSLLHNDHQVAHGLLAKALRIIKSDAKKGAHLVDFGKVVGVSNLVEVGKDDECYEKVRGNRPYPSRFVKNRQPIECSRLVVVWRRINEKHIQVITAYFTNRDTPDCPDEPANIRRKINNGKYYTQSQIRKAEEFWSTHAFIESLST